MLSTRSCQSNSNTSAHEERSRQSRLARRCGVHFSHRLNECFHNSCVRRTPSARTAPSRVAALPYSIVFRIQGGIARAFGNGGVARRSRRPRRGRGTGAQTVDSNEAPLYEPSSSSGRGCITTRHTTPLSRLGWRDLPVCVNRSERDQVCKAGNYAVDSGVKHSVVSVKLKVLTRSDLGKVDYFDLLRRPPYLLSNVWLARAPWWSGSCALSAQCSRAAVAAAAVAVERA